jgi:hypothetical protein
MPNPEGAPIHTKIDFNLDTIEREQHYAPFTIVVADRRMTLVDPKEIDWKDLLDIEQPIQFLSHVFASDEDKAFFKQQNFPGWKLDKMIEQYTKHYGLTNQGGGAASRL